MGQIKFTAKGYSDLTNVRLRSNNLLNNVDNIIVTNSDGTSSIGVWSRYKAIVSSLSHAIQAAGFSTKIHDVGGNLSDNDIVYRTHDTSSKILIPYKAYSFELGTKVFKYVSYIFPIWYIPDDTKKRILSSLGSNGSAPVVYKKWSNTLRMNNTTYYAYTKLLNPHQRHAYLAGDRTSSGQFPYRGPLTYAKENNADLGSFTKAFRYCGADVDNLSFPVPTQNIDRMDFVTDMDNYDTTFGQPVTLQFNLNDTTLLAVKIDYLNRYGAQVTQTITSNTSVSIMVGSVVYITPCLVSNWAANNWSHYAKGVVSNNSGTCRDGSTYTSNPTIYCALMDSKVNLETNYPNSFRIVHNCTFTVSRELNGSPLKRSGAVSVSYYGWSTKNSVSASSHYVAVSNDDSKDSSYDPGTSYNRFYVSSYGAYWPSKSNRMTTKLDTVPNGSMYWPTDKSTGKGTIRVRLYYDSNGFINGWDLGQTIGSGSKTVQYNFWLR